MFPSNVHLIYKCNLRHQAALQQLTWWYPNGVLNNASSAEGELSCCNPSQWSKFKALTSLQGQDVAPIAPTAQQYTDLCVMASANKDVDFDRGPALALGSLLELPNLAAQYLESLADVQPMQVQQDHTCHIQLHQVYCIHVECQHRAILQHCAKDRDMLITHRM